METGPTFEEYLRSKKIDAERFREAEPQLWEAWKREFEQVHPNSFTVQKLNLINPLRRKYLLVTESQVIKPAGPPAPPVVRPAKPVIRPAQD